MDYLPSVMMWLLSLFCGPVEGLDNITAKYLIDNRDQIIACAKELQILPRFAENYILKDKEDTKDEFITLYEAYQNLKDTPRVECFNPKWMQWRIRNDKGEWESKNEQIYKWKSFNREYKKYLELRLEWESDRADIISNIILETDYLYKIWDLILDINSESHGDYYRRIYYKELKDKLGKEFEDEKLPDFVPVWRFQQRTLKEIVEQPEPMEEPIWEGR